MKIMVTIRLCSVHDYDERSILAACSETSPGDVKPLIIATKDTEWSLDAAGRGPNWAWKSRWNVRGFVLENGRGCGLPCVQTAPCRRPERSF